MCDFLNSFFDELENDLDKKTKEKIESDPTYKKNLKRRIPN